MPVALGNNLKHTFIPSAISVPAQTKCYQNYKKNLDNKTKSESKQRILFCSLFVSICVITIFSFNCISPQKFTFLYEVFNKKEYNDFKTNYMYIDKEVNSLC